MKATVVILTVAVLLALAPVALAEDCTCHRIPDTREMVCTCTGGGTETRRICVEGSGVVEFFPSGAQFKEELRLGESLDYHCEDVVIGGTVEVLLWTPERGHAGPRFSVRVDDGGPTALINALDPASGEGYAVTRIGGYPEPVAQPQPAKAVRPHTQRLRRAR